MSNSKRKDRKDCASPVMRKKLDALGKALGAQVAEDLKEYGLEFSDLFEKKTSKKRKR